MKATFVALALVAAACSHRAGQASSEPTPDQNVKTSVKVENQNFADMNVYVVSSAGRVRLGLVTGMSSQVFEIPADIVRLSPQVRFELHPIGSRRNPISETITVMPGDMVQLTIPPE